MTSGRCNLGNQTVKKSKTLNDNICTGDFQAQPVVWTKLEPLVIPHKVGGKG